MKVTLSEHELRSYLTDLAHEAPPAGAPADAIRALGRRMRRRTRVAASAAMAVVIAAVAALTVPAITGARHRPVIVTNGYEVLASASGSATQSKSATFKVPQGGHVEVQLRCTVPAGTVGAVDVTLEYSPVPAVTVTCDRGFIRSFDLESKFGQWHPGLTYTLTVTPRSGLGMTDWQLVVFHITAAQDLLNTPVK